MNAREASLEVVKTLRRHGHDAVFAGGCVRDMLMNREPSDYDVATSAQPDEVLKLFERTFAVGRQFGVVVVVVDSHNVEVATFRTDGPYTDGRRPDFVRFSDREGDVRRRDFTVNGLLCDPLTGEIIDLVGGRADIEAKLIRAIGDPVKRFQEDRLRLLRAVRFAARLDFEIEPETRRVIRESAGTIVTVSAERIADEFRKMLVDSRRSCALTLMDELGLLEHLLPEIVAMKGVQQGLTHHPEGDVFQHTLLTLRHLENPSFELALATLLHDVGKPVTARPVEGAIFVRHAAVGEEIARAICRRLKLSNDETDRVTWLVRSHMRFRDVRLMRESTLKRLFAEPFIDELGALIRADILGSFGDLTDYEWALQRKREFEQSGEPLKPLLSGDDLVGMGFTPGPEFRKILEALVDAQLEGKVTTRDEAEKFVRGMTSGRQKGC